MSTMKGNASYIPMGWKTQLDIKKAIEYRNHDKEIGIPKEEKERRQGSEDARPCLKASKAKPFPPPFLLLSPPDNK